MTRNPTDTLHNAVKNAEVRRNIKTQFPHLDTREQTPEEVGKKEWQGYVKTAIWQRYPHNKPKDYLTKNDHTKFLKLRLAAEADRDKDSCPACGEKASFKHYCLTCPKFKEQRKHLRDISSSDINLHFLTHTHSTKTQRDVNVFLSTINSLAQSSVASPPPQARDQCHQLVGFK